MPRSRKMPLWINLEAITPRIERSATLREKLASLITEGGTTSHSRAGETVAYFLRGLEEARVPYSLHCDPGNWMSIVVQSPEERRAGVPLGV